MQIETLMHTYGDYLFRIAFIYTKDASAAEEVVQDVFFNYYRKHEQFQGAASLKTYLAKMTVNRSYDYLNSWKNKGRSFIEKIQSPQRQTEQYVLKQELYGEITAAVLTLPVKYREVLLLYYFEEMTTKEIAHFTQTPESTIKSRLQQARKMLKPLLVHTNWEVLEYD